MSSRQTLQATPLPARTPGAQSARIPEAQISSTPGAPSLESDGVAPVRNLATRTASPLVQSRAEAWAVVHCAERLGYRDISDALHQVIDSVADVESTDEKVQALDAARDHALACLDACGALAGDTEDA